ncbi:MAG: radical SAM family heme chaperone HemW [Nocardioides sp.]
MPSVPPPGESAPSDGALGERVRAGLGSRPFGVYVHIPFCAARCGYCDFNTYTPSELGEANSTARSTYVEAVVKEIRMARAVLGAEAPAVRTVFFGGGTPTLLHTAHLGAVLAAISAEFGLADDAEITTEANPDSVAQWDLEELRGAGINRISFGMQSAVSHVLGTLQRTHDPLRIPAVVGWARAAGFEQISLDLIYGTPAETLADWQMSLEAALACRPDHLSTYALIIERGTALYRQVRSGELARPNDDDMAEQYLLADERLTSEGFDWYELSNWARDDASRSRHNLLYWTGGNWWGVGAGAHSHVDGVRWWNVRHPTAYAGRLAQGVSPAEGREVLDPAARRMERVMLEVRLRSGLSVAALDNTGLAAIPELLARGLIISVGGRLVLTRDGRLLADAVVRDLVG